MGKLMKKRTTLAFLFVIAALLAITLAACAPAAPPPAPTKAAAQPALPPTVVAPAKAEAGQFLPPKPVPADFDKPLGNIPMAGGPTGGSFYPITARIAYLINKYGKEAKTTSSSTGGSVENAKLVGSGEVFFAMTASDIAFYARDGKREFKEAYPDILSTMAGHSSVMHVGVNADSPIKDARDLKGKSIGVGTAGSSNHIGMVEWLSTLGISEKEVNFKFIAIPDAITALKDRTIDAAAQLVGVPGASWVDLTTSAAIRLIGLPDADMKALNAKFPYFSSVVIKGGTYKGNDKDLSTFGVVNLLNTNKKTPPHVVYNVVKIISENTKELAEAYPAAGDWNLENARYASSIPMHPAAEQYLKERGALK